jgi:hypothetical protein
LGYAYGREAGYMIIFVSARAVILSLRNVLGDPATKALGGGE